MAHKTTPELLLDLRTAKGWTLTTVAEKSGINRSSLSQYERGIVDIPFKKLRALATTYGVSIRKLL